MESLQTRRFFLSQGVLGVACLGLGFGCTRQAPFYQDTEATKLSEQSVLIIDALAPSVLGIQRSFFDDIRDVYLARLATLFAELPPYTQTNLQDLFRFLDFTPLRWMFRVFSSWQSCSDRDAQVFMAALSQCNITLIQLVHQGLVSYLASGFYSLPESWQDIQFHPQIDFGQMYE